VFPVRQELNSYMSFRRNLVSEGLRLRNLLQSATGQRFRNLVCVTNLNIPSDDTYMLLPLHEVTNYNYWILNRTSIFMLGLGIEHTLFHIQVLCFCTLSTVLSLTKNRNVLFKTHRFGDWILSPSSGKTYSIGPNR
jgi:hypothetical protein